MTHSWIRNYHKLKENEQNNAKLPKRDTKEPQSVTNRPERHAKKPSVGHKMTMK